MKVDIGKFRLVSLAVEEAVAKGTDSEEQVLQWATEYGRSVGLTRKEAEQYLNLSLKNVLYGYRAEPVCGEI